MANDEMKFQEISEYPFQPMRNNHPIHNLMDRFSMLEVGQNMWNDRQLLDLRHGQITEVITSRPWWFVSFSYYFPL